MRIRFLELTASDRPDWPFEVGQVIGVSELTPQVRAWLRVREDGSSAAEAVREDEAEIAEPVPSETPEPKRKGRRP